MVTDIAGKWFLVSVSGLGVHAEPVVSYVDVDVVDASADEKMGEQGHEGAGMAAEEDEKKEKKR